MSDPKEKKTGGKRVAPKPEVRPAKKPEVQPAKKPEKQPAKKPESQGPKRSTGGVKPEQKKPEPPLTKQQKILKGLYMALTVISAVIVVGYIGISLFAAPPDVDHPSRPSQPPRTEIITTVDPETGEEIEIEVEIPGLSANRKKEVYTVLLVGMDQTNGNAGLTDTMMLGTYDVPNQKLKVMNLPRDTYIRFRGGPVLLNSVFSRSGGGENGMKALRKEVQELTGIYPDFYVMIQWEALGELVDAIDGVYFEVPFDMYYNDLSQHFKIDLKGGYQLLDGNKAMQLVRYRQNSIGDTGRKDPHYGYAEGDLGRIKTQQAFMKAIIAKCLQPDVLLPNLSEYISIFQKNVETDMTVGNMAYFGKSAIGGLDMDSVSFVTLPNNYAGDGHLLPIGSQIVRTVNDGMNPYEQDIQLRELDLATAADLPKETEDPEETEDPDATDDPEETDDPETSGSPRPTESEGAILPPGTFTRPSAAPSGRESPTPGSSASPAPSGSPRPGESARPTPSGSESPRPTGSEKPESTPGGIMLPGGITVNPTTEPSPPPADTPEPPPVNTPASVPADEEPVLPPM